MTGYTLEVSGEDTEGFVWVDAEGLREHAVPSAFARYYEEANIQLRR
jgi:A/G-specific adenine glycosylase